MFPDSRTRKELLLDSTNRPTKTTRIFPRPNNNSKRKANGQPNRQNPLSFATRHKHH